MGGCCCFYFALMSEGICDMKIMRMILTGFVFVAIFISVNTVVANTEDYIADISTSYGSQETMSNDLAIALIQNEPEERFSLSSHLRYLYPLMKLERIWKGIITNPLEEIKYHLKNLG